MSNSAADQAAANVYGREVLGAKPEYERITVDQVQVGDRVARTRSEYFPEVASIDDAPLTRRLHFAREACSRPGMKASPTGNSYCKGCFRRRVTLEAEGHGTQGGGNIRPRRTAKLWRIVRAA